MRRLKLFAIIAAVLVTVGIQQTKVVSAAEKANSKVQMDNVDTRNLDNTVVLGAENKVNGVAQDKKADANKNLNAAVDVNAHVKVGMFNGSTSSSSNSINPKFKVTNTGSSSIKLSNLKLRYYYTSDDNKEQSFWCDYAATTSGTYSTLTSNVTGVFGKLNQAVTNADSYLEIGFNEAAGTLEAGQTMEIQTRVSKVDWSNYTQSNDYSFDSKDSNYVESDKVTATLNGTTLWGVAPDGKVTIDPVITTESATFDKYVKKAADINIGIKFNDNVLKALSYYNGTSYVPMVKEKDYIVTDAGVTLSKDFLSTLPLGKTTISFDFDKASSKIVTIEVINSTPSSVITPASSVYDQSKKADIPVTITFNDNTLVSINDGKKDLTAGTDYILKDNVATLTQAYLDTLPVGDSVLTFKFSAGDVQKLTVTVKPVVMNLNVVIGNATGKAGTTVVVPVTVKGITKNGMNACTFTLSYDKNLFENVKVTPGDICVNPDATFIPSVDAANGLINIFYCDSTGEELEAILKDGLFFNISFDIKNGLKSQSSDVKVSDSGNFVDTKSKAYSLNYTNGSISIVGEQVVNSAITPASSVYDQGNKADIPVTITYNGNTLVSINDGKKDLTAGTDYILKDNVATLTQAYLDTLPAGDTVLTFKFSAGDVQKLTVTVKPVVMNLNVVIGNATGKAGTTVVVPVTVKGITKNGMNACTFTLSYDKNLFENVKVTPGDICVNPDATFIPSVDAENGLINIFYCDSTGAELEAILKDGLFFNISFDIKAGAKEGTTDVKVSDPGNFVDTKSAAYNLNYTNGSVTIVGVPVDKFSTNIGAVEGKAGDTLVIPVSLKNIPVSGISSLDLKFKYDSNLIDIVSVAPGSIIANPKANFSYYDNKNNNLLSMSFLDFEATGKDLIKSSGDLVYITVKIKDTATPGVTKLSDNGETNFGDADGKDLIFVLNNGTITIH
ncbi:cohesin domain-containing protein [Inconstantimicrobium mannanitabidum]|uniref:Uncharacterized protein n=1 Tax=Inconstantimicrobium mannanitabidum TaxID=1604901 RepID=A0ACB5RDD6_9CLOT|nr:cohesin domain-containing protein [Clostridium sp. TW13]GKX67106.1 hypothetical protein rsdtw13_23640 [Clostridium sp. TW13]